MNNSYKDIWLVFVQIKPEENYSFKELVDSDVAINNEYVGAWSNLIVRADNISDALDIVPRGLKEKNFEVLFIDKIENVQSLVEFEEIDLDILKEIDWLLSSEYVFMISDKIFPYTE